MVAESFGEGFDSLSEVGHFGEYATEAAGVSMVAVFFDHGPERGVSVEARSAYGGLSGDGGESDGLSCLMELGADTFDSSQGVGGSHPAIWLAEQRPRGPRLRQPARV